MINHICTILIVLLATPESQTQNNNNRNELLKGVQHIHRPGVPGPFSIVHPDAFTVVAGKEKDVFQPVVCGLKTDQGRIVTFGHGGYFSKNAIESKDTAKLIQNAVSWAGNKDSNHQNKVSKIRVLIHRSKDLLSALTDSDFIVEKTKGNNWHTKLSSYQVLITDSHHLSNEEIKAVQEFIKNGGGLLTSGLAWGWLQLNPDKKLLDHPGNKLLGEFGIYFADGYLNATHDNGFICDQPSNIINITNANFALQHITQHAKNNKSTNKTDKITQNMLHSCSVIVTKAIQTLPSSDTSILPVMKKLAESRSDFLTPTEKSPIGKDHALDRVLLSWQIKHLQSEPPHKIKTHPAATDFPGLVKPDAKNVRRKVYISMNTPGWQSTGLYVPSGKVVQLQCSENIVKKGIQIRIGCHSDKLWHKKSWNRCPEISHTIDLDEKNKSIASAFGGLLYFIAPKKGKNETIEVIVNGAIDSPQFILGKTTNENWQQQIKSTGAPWAELHSDKIILSVPVKEASKVTDPESLMKFWNQIADSCADLAVYPRERNKPERFVADRQISAGYMHAGYPIMTHLDAASRMVDITELQKGEWGLFHELGHNHQSSDWTFSGTGEVTVNLFTLYVYDTLLNRYEESRPKLFGNSRKETIQSHIQNGAPFQKWKSDPFLALIMYMQIREAFGWEVYKKVFKEYSDLTYFQRPTNDDEKRDQWMIRLSKTLNHNLGPFFTAWGVPTSQSARDSIKNLPVWMPEDWPEK